MKRYGHLCGLWSGLMLISLNAAALSYVPLDDEHLLKQADLVAVGVLDEAIPAPGRELDEIRYRLVVTDLIRGNAGMRQVQFLVPGSLNRNVGGALIVPGAPRFAQAEKALVFLSQRIDGTYIVTQFSLGAFHYLESSDGEVVLDRDLLPAEAVHADGGPPYRRYRNAQRFLAWLHEKAAGRAGDAAYWSEAANIKHQKYALSNPAGRWFEFDQNLDVPVYASASGQFGLLSGGYPELQQAINAWNQSGAPVSLVYMGRTTASGGLSRADGVTEVLFNDPNDEIGGDFDCQNGGIGAYTKWRGGGTRYHQGRFYYAITEADIVVQDGIGCLLSQLLRNNAEEMLGHELGHLLGLAHPCGDAGASACVAGTLQDDALMRPSLHNDGRGARLNEDDRAGAGDLYAGADSASPDEPVVVPGPGDSGGGGLGSGVLRWLSVLALFNLPGSRRQVHIQG